MNLPNGPLTEDLVTHHIRPLFSRCLRQGEIYLANHSLGRPLDSVRESVTEAVRLWEDRLDASWDEGGWLDMVERFRSGIARLIGLSRPDCVVPKTSAGQGLRAVLNSYSSHRPVRVVATTGEFDSVDFILKTYAEHGRAEIEWVEPTAREGSVPLFESESIQNAITDGTDLVVVSAVFFTTGQVLDGVPAIVEKAHASGARVLLDVYHAAGVFEFDLPSLGADFAIGGAYKYLRGGPGACFLAMRPEVADDEELQTSDTGWFAKADTFGYQRANTTARKLGGDGWLESTPPILTAYQAVPGIEFCETIGVSRLREYNLQQQQALRKELRQQGVPVFEPSKPERFGAFTLVPAVDTAAIVKKLHDHGVTVDARGGFVRLGPDLLNTHADFEAVAQILSR